MSSATTSCVRHRANTRFFIKYEDILYVICGGNQAKCAAHRVLEVKTNNRVVLWQEQGGTGTPPEDFLWFIMDWDDFVDWSLEDRNRTSFRAIIPKIEEDGYLLSRYVKVDDRRQVICDSRGCPYTWCTYAEARDDHTVNGLIMNQYRYLFAKVNAKLDGDGGGERAPEGGHTDPPGGDGEDATNTGPAAPEGVTSNTQPPGIRGGNLQSASAPADEHITPPCQNQQGGTAGAQGVTCSSDPATSDTSPVETGKGLANSDTTPPVNSDKKNLLLLEESVQHQAPIAPAGAGGDKDEQDACLAAAFAEDELWSEEVILHLAERFLPSLPTHISKKQQKENAAHWQRAAHRIYQSMCMVQMPEEDRPAYLARLLLYLADADAPCAYRRYVEGQIGRRLAVRLWHLADNLDPVAADMERTGWRPREEADPGTAGAPAQPAAGGMTCEEADEVLCELRASYPRVPRRLGCMPGQPRSCRVQIKPGGTIVTLASRSDFLAWQHAHGSGAFLQKAG